MAVIEKGKACGAHTLSGANMVPSAMRGAVPGPRPGRTGPFAYQEVTKDAVYLLTKKRGAAAEADAAELPQPRQLRDLGLEARRASSPSKAEEEGAYILTETVADKLLVEDRIVRGIRSGDRGRGRDGERARQLRAGLRRGRQGDRARRGHARPPDPGARSTTSTSHGALPVRWELGVKEVWEVEKPLDRVIHTMGWPLRKARRSGTSSAAASSTRWARTSSASAWSSGSTTPTRPSPSTTCSRS